MFTEFQDFPLCALRAQQLMCLCVLFDPHRGMAVNDGQERILKDTATVRLMQCPGICLKVLRKAAKILSQVSGIPIIIETDGLPNTGLVRYRCANLLDAVTTCTVTCKRLHQAWSVGSPCQDEVTTSTAIAHIERSWRSIDRCQVIKHVQNYWSSELYPSSGILNTRRLNVSEAGSVSVLR
jgi:hypothetical protein